VTPRPPRSAAEWVSLVGAVAVVAAVVALILAQIPGEDRPAAPTATVDAVQQVGDAFHVDVTVTNAGSRTAANVQVAAELTVGGEEQTGDQTIDFLSGGEDQRLSFVFDDDPADGELRVAITGYAEP
jgi:uncharacterized protein (TIGR02588 family)